MEDIATFRKKVQKSQVNYTSPLYARKVIRKFSPYITRLIVSKTDVSANQVTIWQLIVSILGLGMLCLGNVYLAFTGSLLLHLGYVFDCVDGEVARYKKSPSINGMFLDFVNHEVVIPLTYTCLAFHYYFKSDSIGFFVMAVLILVLKNNPIGKARQTTIDYLIERRKSPTYDINQYAKGPLDDHKASGDERPDSASAGSTAIQFLQTLRKRIRAFLSYPNDMIIVSCLLIIESVFKEIPGQLFVILLTLYLCLNFIFDLWWHMKKQVAQREFFNYLEACTEINEKRHQEPTNTDDA